MEDGLEDSSEISRSLGVIDDTNEGHALCKGTDQSERPALEAMGRGGQCQAGDERVAINDLARKLKEDDAELVLDDDIVKYLRGIACRRRLRFFSLLF